ncbi:MAG TPA: phosphoenolpyruvate synthase [Gemmatimonadaceae bacterium]|nr:phosphoenolpyruvate synthase [Gemmatimonadaceae bacterium]
MPVHLTPTPPGPVVDPTTVPFSAQPEAPASLVRWLKDIGRPDVDIAGGKGANLGELMRAGLPVPDGFVVTVDAYRRARAPIDALVSRAKAVDPEDTAALQAIASEIRRTIESTPVPDDVRAAIAAAYVALSGPGAAPVPVAVRSSATAEDTAQHSFAGMFESFLEVRGVDDLLNRVRACWGSSFGTRVLYYRLQRELPVELPIAVVVQRMVVADKSGIVFTADPVSHDRAVLVIEAVWGLGETVVGGQVNPDRYVVNKASRAVVRKSIARKDLLLQRDPVTGHTQPVDLRNDPRATSESLTSEELDTVIDLSLRTEAHYHAPVDIEFAIEAGHVLLTQTRPITTLGDATPVAERNTGKVLVRGVGASPGQVSGRVRILTSPTDATALREGEVLVTRSTSPDWAPLMRRAAAIVTDAGGITSHAAIVSRELGIPCVVGTRDGTQVLQDGTVVTVNGNGGTVVAGAVSDMQATPLATAMPEVRGAARAPVTATRLYVNLADPTLAEATAARDVDGVGLLRAEFMMLSALEGTHPKRLIESGRSDEFIARMADGLRTFARAFHPRPVIYRAMDFRTNEVRGLAGGDVEPVEANPMIGYRGCYRYGVEPDLFRLELRAIADVRRDHPNLHVMIPFVRTLSEFEKCKIIIDDVLGGERGMELWIMAEVPSVIHWLPAYARLGITGVSIGSNDLTQLVLGVDRDSALVAPLFDERDGAVLAAIRSIIRRARSLGLTSSICGQAPSTRPEYVEELVRWGIDSVSVNPDVIDVTRRNLAAAEQRLLLECARQSGDT